MRVLRFVFRSLGNWHVVEIKLNLNDALLRSALHALRDEHLSEERQRQDCASESSLQRVGRHHRKDIMKLHADVVALERHIIKASDFRTALRCLFRLLTRDDDDDTLQRVLTKEVWMCKRVVAAICYCRAPLLCVCVTRRCVVLQLTQTGTGWMVMDSINFRGYVSLVELCVWFVVSWESALLQQFLVSTFKDVRHVHDQGVHHRCVFVRVCVCVRVCLCLCVCLCGIHSIPVYVHRRPSLRVHPLSLQRGCGKGTECPRPETPSCRCSR
jgi:hypothetical protein